MIKTTTLVLGLSILISASAFSQQNSRNHVKSVSHKKSPTATSVIKTDNLPLSTIPPSSITVNGDELIHYEGFEKPDTLDKDWYVEFVSFGGYAGDDTATWIKDDVGASPSVSPLEGDSLIYFNSSSTAFSESRLVIDSLDFTDKSFVYLDFFMYQSGDVDADCKEFISVQVSLDSVNWENVSEPIYRAVSGMTEGWKNHAINLSAYAGNSDVYIGFLGKSSNYCSNLFLDSISIKAANPIDSLTRMDTIYVTSVSGETAEISLLAVANAEQSDIYIECDTSLSFENPVISSTLQIGGFFPEVLSFDVSGLMPDDEYHIRAIAMNSEGESTSDTNVFNTLTVSSPQFYGESVIGNDGNQLAFSVSADGSNALTKGFLNYGFWNDSTPYSIPLNPQQFTGAETLNATIDEILLDSLYYYKVVLMNSVDTSESMMFSVQSASKNLYDTLLSGNAFLKGRYINLGIAENGVLGSSVNAPSDIHARPSGSPGGDLGFVADTDKDGWYTGEPGFIGDYFLPGSPEEGWGMHVNDTNYNNNGNSPWMQIPGSITSVKDSLEFFMADWDGELSGININQRVKLPVDSLYFVFEVTLSNTTDSTLYDVYYMRNVDPDNEYTTADVYETINSVVYQNPGTDNRVLVSAIGSEYNSYVGLCANDARARVTHGEFSNREPIVFWEGDSLGYEIYTEGTRYQDAAITLTFKIDSMQAGECTTLVYAYVLSESQVESALRATMLELGVDGGAALVNNVDVCTGNEASLTIEGGEDYAWVWTNAENEVVSTTNMLTIAEVNTEMEFQATGSFHCFDTTFNISVQPQDYPLATVSNEAQIIYTGEQITAIEPGFSNEITGGSFEWSRTAPDGISTEMPLSGTLAQGESLEGFAFESSSDNEITVEFTFVPFGPANGFCEGDPVSATVTVQQYPLSVDLSYERLFSVYPNPNNGIFTLEYKNVGNGSAQLKVMNSAGQLVHTQANLKTINTIDLSALEAGVYFVHVSSDKITEQVRIIVQ